MPDPQPETFRMDDGRSYKKLSKNGINEENSARSYRIFMIEQLKKHGGVMEQSQLEAAVLRNYGHTFGPADRRKVQCFGTTRPKWKNTIDWAKAAACRMGQVATRSRTEDKVKKTYIVLLEPEGFAPDEWVTWALQKRKKIQFTKKCPKCNTNRLPLAEKVCPTCGYRFPPPSERRDRIPVTS